VQHVRQKIAESVYFKNDRTARPRRYARVKAKVQAAREQCRNPAGHTFDLLEGARAYTPEERLTIAATIAEMKIRQRGRA